MNNLDNKNSLFFWGVIFLLLAIIIVQLYLTDMPVTGDEPGYIYKALSFWHTGGFHMPMSQFALEMPQFQSLVATGANLGAEHPVVMSMIAAPLAGLFGVDGVRSLSVLCGLASVVAMACLMRREFGAKIALLSTGFVIFTFPALPYTHLFYTEMMMMMLVAESWALGRRGGRNCALLAVLCALLLPFIHIRSAMLSPTLVLFAVFPLWQQRDWRGLAAAACLCGLGGGLFLLQQFVLFGQLVAGASATFEPSLGGAFTRFSVQLVEFRHGLLTVNPACILAIAGLVLGFWRRSSLAAQAGVILLLYVPLMIWGTASESWPARFWTPVMPVMAVGMGLWLAYARGAPARTAGAILVLAAFLNSLILLRYNGSFLNNRFSDLSADAYSPFRNHFDIAGLLPWDSFDFTIVGIDPVPALDERLLIRAMAFCIVLLLAFVINGLIRTQREAKWTTWLPVAALLPLFVAAAMRPVPSSTVAISCENRAVVLNFSCPAPVRLIRIMAPVRALMVPPAYPSGLEIAAAQAGDGLTESWRAPFAPVLGIPAGRYRSIRLTAFGSGADGVWKQADFIAMTAGLRSLRCD